MFSTYVARGTIDPTYSVPVYVWISLVGLRSNYGWLRKGPADPVSLSFKPNVKPGGFGLYRDGSNGKAVTVRPFMVK